MIPLGYIDVIVLWGGMPIQLMLWHVNWTNYVEKVLSLWGISFIHWIFCYLAKLFKLSRLCSIEQQDGYLDEMSECSCKTLSWPILKKYPAYVWRIRGNHENPEVRQSVPGPRKNANHWKILFYGSMGENFSLVKTYSFTFQNTEMCY